jgi:formylglycine-generating enzyme required for sulfatase activity
VRYRVLRGGSWFECPDDLRSAARWWGTPDKRDFHCGFRVARTL